MKRPQYAVYQPKDYRRLVDIDKVVVIRERHGSNSNKQPIRSKSMRTYHRKIRECGRGHDHGRDDCVSDRFISETNRGQIASPPRALNCEARDKRPLVFSYRNDGPVLK